jgi:hypothetical protein
MFYGKARVLFAAVIAVTVGEGEAIMLLDKSNKVYIPSLFYYFAVNHK